MHTERLAQLADLLDHWKNRKYPAITDFSTREWMCGTSACAIGTAMHDPWFNRQGLMPGPEYKVNGVTRGGWFAVKRFFDITSRDALFLFESRPNDELPFIGATPARVARRIRNFIRMKAAEHTQPERTYTLQEITEGLPQETKTPISV